ncbi:oligosaccharide flippase family protein [Cognatishimia activa]|uniref:oligosaccharide flippase family protein n=1 Tax=Cognatishimia activa TaxID=1715691 RepID=UPI002230CF1D|nr:oligosaccharide flippase family protein [Cognatishimia activa]UZD90426.1 oligosaccharide flippase family protein [Cognatishimia activa]
MTRFPPVLETKSTAFLPNAVIAILGQSSQQISSLILALLAAMVLSVADYGLFMLAVAVIEFVILFAHAGFFHHFIHSEKSAETFRSTMFLCITGIGLLGGIAVWLLAPHLAKLFGTPDLTSVLRILAVLQPFGAVIAWSTAALIREGRTRRYYEILCVGNTCSLIAGAALLLVWPSIYALVFYRILRVSINLGLFLRAAPVPKFLLFDTKDFKAALRFARGIYGAKLSDYISNFGADLLLAYMFSTSESGLYRIANRLAVAATEVVVLPLRIHATKAFAKCTQKARSMTQEYSNFLSSGSVMIGGMSWLIFFLADDLVTLLFRSDYVGAVIIIQILAFRALALWPYQLFEPVLMALNKTTTIFVLSLLWLLMSVLVVLFASPQGMIILSAAQVLGAIVISLVACNVLTSIQGIDVRTAAFKSSSALILVIAFGGLAHLSGLWIESRVAGLETQLFLRVASLIALGVGMLLIASRTQRLTWDVFESR